MKRILSIVAVLAIVSGALAFKVNTKFHDASVYCDATCLNAPVLFKVDPTGFNTIPCGSGVQPYVLTGATPTLTCIATVAGTKFKAVIDSKK